MRQISVLFAGLVLSTSSLACSDFRSARDGWGGSDKAKHFTVSAVAGAFGAYFAQDTRHPVLYGTLLGSVPGLLKELSDGCRAGGSGFSGKDMAYNIAGAFVGARLGMWSLSYQKQSGKDVVTIGYRQSF